jgi:predicted transcriptional regulator
MKSQTDDINNYIHTEKFNMLNADQKFVNETLERKGLEIKWLSDKLNMDYETVRYQLRQAQNYRQDFHSRVVEIFKREGMISSNKEVCDRLKDDLIDLSTVLSGTLSVITRSVKEKIHDRNLDPNEKRILRDQIRAHQNRVNDQLNDILITIDLK